MRGAPIFYDAEMNPQGGTRLNRARATGGMITDASGLRYHTFISSGVFTVTEPGTMQHLIVGGAGGAAWPWRNERRSAIQRGWYCRRQPRRWRQRRRW